MTANLADRVEGLNGSCRETDALIAVALGHEAMNELFYRGDWSDRMSDEGAYEKLPRYTASLDAVAALVEKELPGAVFTLGCNVHHRFWSAQFQRLDAEGAPQSLGWGHHNTSAPLALLAALLRAKEADHG